MRRIALSLRRLDRVLVRHDNVAHVGAVVAQDVLLAVVQIGHDIGRICVDPALLVARIMGALAN